MRLTKAVSGKGGKYLVDLLDIQVVADKLGLLEDIEEELGIDLVKLFKALKYGIYTDNNGFIGPLEMQLFNNNLILYRPITSKYPVDMYLLCEYGKTWAFTKKELKNERV